MKDPHAPAPARSGPAPKGGGPAQLAWRDPGLALVLAATLLLSLAVWWRVDGYALADSIEYLEHAQALVRGERVVDSKDIRGVGFALVLAPPFLVADWLGLQDLRWIVPCTRMLQILFTLLLVGAVARLGTLLAGRAAGLGAAWIAGTSPVLLTFSIEPVADVLAALLLAQALLLALEPGGPRRGFALGLWLGAALLVAFKTLLVTGPLVLLVVLRDLGKRPRAVGGLVLGLGILLLVQVGLDRLRYGDWGRSLNLYLTDNALRLTGYFIAKLGFVEAGRRLYELSIGAHIGRPYTVTGGDLADVRQAVPASFYLVEASRFVAWPGLALVALGAARTLARPRWVRLLLFVLVAAAGLVTAFKGSKDFRIWLPLLPAVAGLAALGLGLLGAARGGRVLAVLLVSASVVLALARLAGGGSQRHAGYWRAMDVVNADAAAAGAPLRVSGAWHWALFLREGRGVELVKLPHHVESWPAYDEQQRARSLEVLATLDRFVVHLPVLTERPALFSALNELFAVEALLFDPARYRDLGPVLVLARRRGPPGDPSQAVFFELLEGRDPEDYVARHGLAESFDLLGRTPEGTPERLRLLGFDVESLPGGHAWLTLHWLAVAPSGLDLRVHQRIATEPAGGVQDVYYVPAWGLHPTPSWTPGLIVREGRPLVAAVQPFDPSAPWRALGQGPEGTVLDAELLLAVFAPPGPGLAEVIVLQAARPGADTPLAALGPPESDRFDPEGRLRVGRFPLRRPTVEVAGSGP